MRLPYELVERDTSFYLWVDEQEVSAIREQLQKYDQENRNWPPKPLMAMPGDRPSSPLTLIGFAALLIIFFAAQNQWPFITALGASNNESLIDGGQWELPMTALTLHGGLDHLISNLVSGLCFGLLINRTLGAGLGWVLVLLSGYLGNVANAYFYWPALHGSIGASTAIFGALGLLVGNAIAARFSPSNSISLKHRIVPLAAGIIILLLTGFSDGNTDILAHVFGFGVGLPLGALGFVLNQRFTNLANNRLLLGLPLALIALAWAIAAL